MKPRQLLPTIFALGAVAALGLQGAQAESPSYSDLEKRMSFDKSPIKSKEAAVASYAPALEKVMHAVFTIASRKAIEVDSARRKQQEELFRRMFPDVPEEFFDRFEDAPERKARGLGSGVIISPDGVLKSLSTVQYSRGTKLSISCSRAQISRSATDCTRPAERLPGSFRHSTGDRVKPTR